MPCGPSKNHLKMYEIGKEFMADPAVKKMYKNASILVHSKFKQLFGFAPEEWKAWQPNKKDIRLFKRELKYVKKFIKKGKLSGTTPFSFLGLNAANLYTTSGVVRRHPLLAKLYDNFLSSAHKFKGNTATADVNFEDLLTQLSQDSVETGMLTNVKSFKQAQKKARMLEEEIERALVKQKNNEYGADEELSRKQGELDVFLAKGEGKVFKDFVNLIEGKKGLQSVPEIQTVIKDSWGKALSDKQVKIINHAIINSGITNSARMQNALTKYVEMMHNSHHVLHKGVDAYITSIEEGMLIKGETNLVKIQNVKKALKEKLTPDEKVGYYPHYRYDVNSLFLDGLMPKLDKLSETSRFMSDKTGFDAALDDIGLYISKRVVDRVPNLDNKNYSMNFPVVVKRYVDEINRFNYVAHTQRDSRRALREARNAFADGKDLEGYGADLITMIKDLNAAQLGSRDIKHPEFDAMSRAILNMEFTSKLGWNVRSAARNATQGLLNLVEFGPIQMRKSRQYLKNNTELRDKVNKALQESGLLFVESTPEQLESIGTKNMFHSKVRLNEVGEFEFRNPGKMSQFADFTGRVAGLAGGGEIKVGGKKVKIVPYLNMRNIENFNRKETYGVAFSKMYTDLQNSSGFRSMIKDKKGGEVSLEQLESDIFRRSKNYAERMTSLLHFDYGSVSKSKLMRHPVGRFLFQFQHYAHKFAEYNFDIMRESGSAMLAGDIGWNGAMGRGVRMGLAYMIVPNLLSVLFKNDFTKLISHDLAERMEQWWTFFTGSEEEFKNVTYGRGAIGALIGAPALSDALAIAEMTELWNMEDFELLQMAIGYTDKSDLNADQKIAKMARILNTQVGRSFYHTMPMVWEGGTSAFLAAPFELGIYPISEKKVNEKLIKSWGEKLVPDALWDALDMIGGPVGKHIKRATSKKKPFSGPGMVGYPTK